MVNKMKKLGVYRSDGNVDVEIIEIFEKKALIKFPTSYIELISEDNALYPIESSFDYIHPVSKEPDANGISFYGFGDEISSSDRITRVLNLSEYGHDKIIIFGRSANGDYICFDYRHDPKTNNPKVVLMFHDEYGDDNRMLVCPLADSFEEFVDMLYEYKDE